MPMPIRSTSAGSTPTHTPQDCLAGVGGDVLEAFAQGVPRNLRNDLLVAADSITNTMSSLVKELHSGPTPTHHQAPYYSKAPHSQYSIGDGHISRPLFTMWLPTLRPLVTLNLVTPSTTRVIGCPAMPQLLQ
ncbi:hypothetical protein GOODEAATRI_022333 [Goodea atripinnis]|uniref:Uncharacterized protein n=1 Tax=Goodea atripinnis TaxID=208336 RepID=A0ABV0Q052_9TELE